MISTTQLITLLNQNTPLENILEVIPDLDFVSYLEACLEKKGLKKSEVIAQTNMQKNYAYQICNGTKKGSKDKIIQLALAMHLDLHDTNNLLSLSNNGLLYAKVKKDAILIYALQHHYNLFKTNELLIAQGFDALD
ncbi:hypothetical protein PND93_01135 [Faecalicoccus pleomorphus]|uniref:hypothetical protein n=1 Tax=Faecalicoccus pleomorphus TaxID=1323 RepID=UPI001961CB4E|nr:hypothetical protein [Faecalicoccus pleomorphus]MBM6764568.1 hypothetical protein [Faecalicoccus pleomorphus]MBM6808036.1 hypothetical protein [Faecalicoccus pleomorphus]MDB7986365.1 hypothetical protein [Faecalicoccus pleomorphus]MDB7990187.1 hypothetical protein [Faecalicoccus pleomorphus]